MSTSKTAAFGYLMVDHRFSPGLPEETARFCGYNPLECREGKVFEVDTLGCVHCGTHVIPNPDRIRDRAWCRTCDAYICDECDLARKMTGYDHHTIKEITDKLLTGKWALSGHMSRPLLTPALVGVTNG